MQQRVHRLEALVDDHFDGAGGNAADLVSALAGHYTRDFVDGVDKAVLAKELVPELEARFHAAYLAAFYTDFLGAAEMEAVFAALATKGAATSAHHQQFFEVLVKTRQLEKARALQERSASLGLAWEALPVEVDHTKGEAGRRYWEVASSTLQLDRYLWSHADGLEIIVVASPLCHFSQRALTAIASDPQLAPIFESRSLVLVPQSGSLYLPAIQTWNRAHPSLPHRVVYRESDWAAIKDWSTPTFYLFSNGELVQTVSGWPREGRRSELLQASELAASIAAGDPGGLSH